MKKKIALCVAEKPTVAKSVAEFLSNGRFNKVKIVEFKLYSSHRNQNTTLSSSLTT